MAWVGIERWSARAARLHGGSCQRIACENDGDRECGNCIGAECWEHPWYCHEGVG